MNSRKAAFLALISHEKKHIKVFLEDWQKKEHPKTKDLALAREIASGTLKRYLSLKYLILKTQSSLNLSQNQWWLLYSAVYQIHFMDRLPLYAIVNETVEIAKTSFGVKKASFFNAFLKRFAKQAPLLESKDFSILYSYPPFFVNKLLSQLGRKKTKEVLEIQNKVFPLMVRMLTKGSLPADSKHVFDDVYTVKQVKDSSDFYVQNGAFVYLMRKLQKIGSIDPKNILDLCAAPGGKTILAHDLYPKAKLFANDVSEEKIALLKKNFQKYQISSHLSQVRGETFTSKQKFDLILLDVPCSNSGVLHKKVEARWRLTEKNVEELNILQKNLLKNAKNYLTEQGMIWYMTCSILQEEDEDIISWAKTIGLEKVGKSHLILPDQKGFDGCFGAVLHLLT